MGAVPRIVFSPPLRRFVDASELPSAALTLRAALEDAFAAAPRLRGCLLDEHGRLRPNVVVFIDGRRSSDSVALGDALQADSTVQVLQALSGG
jgi:hypothetical protein